MKKLVVFLTAVRLLALWTYETPATVVGFVPVSPPKIRFRLPSQAVRRQFEHSLTTLAATDKTAEDASSGSQDQDPIVLVGVAAPLHRIGPYTCVQFVFPEWKYDNDDDEEVEEGTVSFMIDTGANTNSIDSKLVKKYGLQEYSLPIPPQPVGDKDDDSILSPSKLIGATTSTAESSQAGTLYMLGDGQLAGLPPPPRTFLRNLVAASLPFASPVGVGLLGLPFLWTFPAGVEFDWHGTDGDPPTLIFYCGEEAPVEMAKMESMILIPLQTLLGGLMTLRIAVDGVEMRALLDTGSPVTVLNDKACELLGVDPESTSNEINPFAVKIAGVDGSQSELRRLDETVSVQVLGVERDEQSTMVSLGQGHVWSGELAGIEMIRRLNPESSGDDEPAAVLGLDFLQNAYRMIVRAPSNEVWFEELPDGFERKYA